MSYSDEEIFVAIYCRLSEEDRDKLHEEDDSRSILNQKSMLLSYAQTNQWNVYKVYTDDNFTGADRNRPAFNEMLKDAEAGKFKIVLCKSQSRFTREIEIVEKYLHELFPLWGIRFIGLVDNADTAIKGNKKARQINGLVNEWYLEDLSENIKKVLQDRKAKGYHVGAFAPYGYQKDPEYRGHLIPDPEAAQVVQKIFELYVEGIGRSQIARILNGEKIPNPTEYKIMHGIRWQRQRDKYRSTLWQYFSISDILSNEVYIGNLVQNRYQSISYKTHQCKPVPKEKWIRVENTHAPIIEKELWNKVQEIRAQHARPEWNGEIGVFAKRCTCMYCGYVMRSNKSTNGRRYLRCSSRLISENTCKGGFISQLELENTILKELHEIIDNYLDIDEAEKQVSIQNNRDRKLDLIKREIALWENKNSNIEKALKTLYQDRVDGYIIPEDFLKLSESFRKEEAEYQTRICLLKKKLIDMSEIQTSAQSKRSLLLQLSNIKKLSFEIVNTLIDYVEVGKREGHYKQSSVPVVIHWNF